MSRRTWAVALAMAAAACLLRVIFANQRGFWLDEYFTYNSASMDVDDMIRNRIHAGHSPLYFFYARLGLMLGHSERVLRLTSAVAAGALVLMLTGLMGELKLARFLPVLWIVAIVEPYWISIGTEFRYTMPLVAMAAGMGWVAVRFAERPDRRSGILLGLGTALLLWTHGSAPFFVAGLGIFLVWDGLFSREGAAGDQRLRGALVRCWPIALGFAAAIPFYIMVRNHHSDSEGDPLQAKIILKNLVEVIYCDHKLWFKFMEWKHHNSFFNLEALTLAVAIGLTWLELRRTENRRAWRLLASTIASVPLAMLCFCAFVKNFQGPVRYLATVSIPLTICLAVAAGAAWRASGPRWAYRLALLVTLAAQSSAMALDRGDRHREAIHWIMQTHREKDPVLITTTAMNHVALKYHGFKTWGITKGAFSRQDSVEKISIRIRETFRTAKRGLYIRYHSAAKLREAIDALKRQGFFVGHRHWKIGSVAIGAVARDKSELAWLNGLKPPVEAWGPARGD